MCALGGGEGGVGAHTVRQVERCRRVTGRWGSAVWGLVAPVWIGKGQVIVAVAGICRLARKLKT